MLNINTDNNINLIDNIEYKKINNIIINLLKRNYIFYN